MEVNEQSVWASVCGDLGVTMSPATFNYWIKTCSIRSITQIDQSRVIVELATQSAFHLRTVDERYYGQIKQALEKQLERMVELALVVGLRQEPESRKQESEKGKQEKGSGGQSGEFKEGLFAERRTEVSNVAGLFARYTFESFVVGSSNNLAYAAAKAVVTYPGVRHNPLFIWGGVGVGKTHLMHAVGHALADKGVSKVTYVTSEQFTNDLVGSLRSKTVGAFKEKYRKVGALMVDDVQFFSGKESSQEEFFNTFNVLYQNGVQIILTSDRKPQDIDKLEQRLVSRFLGGLTVDVGLPDYEMRVAIITKKAAEVGLVIGAEHIGLIAANVVTNARELEGTVMRVAAEASLAGGGVTNAMMERIVGVKQTKETKRIRPIALISLVAKHFDFKNKDLLGKSRKAELVLARHIAIHLLRTDLGIQLEKVGEMMGGRDHTTIMHADEKIKSEFETNMTLRESVMKLRQEMYL